MPKGHEQDRGRDGDGLGINENEGVQTSVWLSDQTRLNHCHFLGGTGSANSTLLSQIALQDIRCGRGVGVIGRHGDLIDLLLPHVPPERIQVVVLFDPTDEEFAISFNSLAAASERERDLLATKFIAVMKQNTSSWGAQMSSLLGNDVLAFLYSALGGTLPELQRFLSDPRFRAEFLKTVTNPEVAYFWENEAQLANTTAIGSILSRLDVGLAAAVRIPSAHPRSTGQQAGFRRHHLKLRDDARKMAEEFGGFVAADLMNQPSRFAIAPVGPRDQSFKLEVSFIPGPVRPFDDAYTQVLAATRARYSTPRATIREELAALRGMIPRGKGVDPFAKLKTRQDK